jgi:cytochrome P450
VLQIIAGRDTTRLLLSWFMWVIQSGMMEKAHLAQLDKELTQCPPEELTYAVATKRMDFTDKCLLECLRLFPPVPAVVRYPKQNGTVIDLAETTTARKGKKQGPIVVSSKDALIVHIYSLQRCEAVFENALKFDPERWTNGLNTFPESVFMSFNISPRLCLGRQFALLEAKVFLVHFWNQFKYTIDNGHVRPEYEAGVLLNMKHGLKVNLSLKSS